MLKALIANDKKKTNLMLQEIISWNSLGIEICGMAETGAETRELMVKTAPDIIIVSARLKDAGVPELVRFAAERGIFPACIITGGTRSFDSVYAALKCGVEEYLIGQINPHELTTALKKICDRKLKEEKAAENEQRERRMFEVNKGVIRKHFINDLLAGNVVEALSTMNRVNGEFLFNFRPGIFEGVIIKPDFKNGADVRLEDIARLLDELGGIFEEQLSKRCFELVWYGYRGAVVCVLNYNGEIHKEYEILFERLRKCARDRMDAYLTMAIGTRELEPSSISLSVGAASRAIEQRILLGVDRIIIGSKPTGGDPTTVVTAERERRIKNHTEALDARSLSEELDRMFTLIAEPEEPDATLYYSASRFAGGLVADTLHSAGVLHDNRSAIMDDYYRKLTDCYTPAMMRAAVVGWCVSLVEKVLYSRDSRESPPVYVARAYIREHYMEPIRLTDVAGEVHLNPSYFSTLFKKELGINFNDYLIDCRLDAAKELLRTTKLSISQVTEAIGYTDTKYFSKLFVKIVGVKPTEYRRIYS